MTLRQFKLPGMLAKTTMIYALWIILWMIPGMALARSGEHGVSKEVAALMTIAEKAAVASVDGDPDFIVGVQGLAQPLCFRIEGQAGHVIRLLQDPQTGVVVNARISRPVADATRTYLSAVLIARRNFRVVAKVGRVLVNRYRFAWGPVSVRRVHGHRVLIAPTLLALTLRNMNVTLVVKRHLPEGRRLGGGNNTVNGSSSSPHIATTQVPDVTPSRHHNNVTNSVIASSAARRRGTRWRRPDDVDHGPRYRNRRHRRPADRRRKKDKKKKKAKRKKPPSAKSRSKRETRVSGSSTASDLQDLVSRVVLKRIEIDPGRGSSRKYKWRSVDIPDSRGLDTDAVSSFGDFDDPRHGDSWKGDMDDRPDWDYYRSHSKFPGKYSGMSPSGARSRRSAVGASRNRRKRDSGSSGDDDESSCLPCKQKGPRRFSAGSRRMSNSRPSRLQPRRDRSGSTPRDNSRRAFENNLSRRSSSGGRISLPGQRNNLSLAANAGGNESSSASGDGEPSGSGSEAGSGSGAGAAGSAPIRDMVAYVGFYVADARDLSSQTHGLLGQFLHKDVSLQKVRQKANGVMKARLLVERPRPHHVKATLRTRTNMALNQSSTCWWLREGGVGVVDGVYDDYLAPRFRASDFLPLPPGLIAQ